MARAVPVQARARERYDAILTAAKRHYSQVGRDRFNLDTVAAEAGCSVGTIYRYFEDRIGLMETVLPEEQSAMVQLSRIREVAAHSGLSSDEKWSQVEDILSL